MPGPGFELRVIGSSMVPTFEGGDLLWVEPWPSPGVPAVTPGEVVVVELGGRRYAHRVVGTAGPAGLGIITRGDGCDEDDAPVACSALRGRAVAVLRRTRTGSSSVGWEPLPGPPSRLLSRLDRRLRASLVVGLDAVTAGRWRLLRRAPVPATRELGREHLPGLQRLLGRLEMAGRSGVLPALDELLEATVRVAVGEGAGADRAVEVVGVVALRYHPSGARLLGPLLEPGRSMAAVAAALVADLCLWLDRQPGVSAGPVLTVAAGPLELAALGAAGFLPVCGGARPGALLVRRSDG